MAPVKPAFIEFHIRIDFDRSEVPISQHGDPLPALEYEQTMGPVDVCAHNERVIPALL